MREEHRSKTKGRKTSSAFAKKSLGQNFLVDPGYIEKIIAALNLKGDETVVEIGAGRGALTEKLLARAGSVVAIEFDRELAPFLITQFGSFEHFKLIEADALAVDFAEITKSNENAATIKLVANLPYNISTAILQRLTEQRFGFSEMILMFQREVVERIMAEPGNSGRGYLTVIAEAAFHRERLFDVPPDAFSPRPKVWSSVIRLTPRTRSFADEPDFRTFLGKAFAQKRKTLLNNLKPHFENAMMLIEACGIDPKRRAETLTLEEWARVFAELR